MAALKLSMKVQRRCHYMKGMLEDIKFLKGQHNLHHASDIQLARKQPEIHMPLSPRLCGVGGLTLSDKQLLH